jgi:hypothetical protein
VFLLTKKAQSISRAFLLGKSILLKKDPARTGSFLAGCCPTLSFSLSFEPNQGPIHLKIIGSKEMKEIVFSGLRDHEHF